MQRHLEFPQTFIDGLLAQDHTDVVMRSRIADTILEQFSRRVDVARVRQGYRKLKTDLVVIRIDQNCLVQRPGGFVPVALRGQNSGKCLQQLRIADVDSDEEPSSDASTATILEQATVETETAEESSDDEAARKRSPGPRINRTTRPKMEAFRVLAKRSTTDAISTCETKRRKKIAMRLVIVGMATFAVTIAMIYLRAKLSF